MRVARKDRPGCGLVGEHEFLGCAPAQEPAGLILGGDDLRAGGEVGLRLAGVAGADAVTGADLVVGGQVDKDGLVDAAAGGAPAVGGGGPDGAAALDRVSDFTCTSEVLKRLDPAVAARAVGRLSDALAAHTSDDGVSVQLPGLDRHRSSPLSGNTTALSYGSCSSL